MIARDLIGQIDAARFLGITLSALYVIDRNDLPFVEHHGARWYYGADLDQYIVEQVYEGDCYD